MRRTRAAAVVAALALMVTGVAVVPSAVAAPFDPGAFKVRLDLPQGGQGGIEAAEPKVTCVDEDGSEVDFLGGNDLSSLLSTVTLGGVVLDCGTTMLMEFAAMEQSGSVSNSKVDAGSPGDIEMTCDMSQELQVDFSIKITWTGFSPSIKFDGSTFAMSMKGFQACTWTMQFNDAASSMLTGAITTVTGMKSNSGKVDCPDDSLSMMGDMADNNMVDIHCVPMTTKADITVVGGTGEFADMSGTGSFTDTRYIPMPIPNGGGGGGGGAAADCEANGGIWDAQTSTCDVSGQGDQGGQGEGVPLTQQDCETVFLGVWIGTGCRVTVPNQQACESVLTGRSTWADGDCIVAAPVRMGMPSVAGLLGRALSRAGAGSGMKMTLDTKGPKVVIASPLKVKDKLILGAAPGGKGDLTLKAVAAPKSRCTVTGSYGKLKKPVELSPATVYPDGRIVTGITRKTLKRDLGALKGKAVDIVVSCSLGTGNRVKKFSTTAKITLG